MSRVALVTGGTRGIGAAISKALKTAGYKVAANYGGNDEAAAKFKAETGIAVFKWDVSSFDACTDGVKKVEAELGAIEVLINNAGITRDAMLHRMKPEQWTAVINTNLGSLFNMCRQVIEGMRERKFGRIINISSINGQKGQMGQSNYSASKASLIAYLEALRPGLAKRGVTVTTVCPGFVRTAMSTGIPYRREMKMLEPEQAARHLARAVLSKPRNCVFPFPMRIGLAFLKLMPDRMFDWMMRRAGPEALVVDF